MDTEQVKEITHTDLGIKVGRGKNKGELVKVEAQVPSQTIMTDDDWMGFYGDALITYINKQGAQHQYECTPERAAELSVIRFWKNDYLRYLYNHMTRGLSYDSFGSKFGITQSRKKAWEQIVEWRLVKELGWIACREKWETLGMDMVDGSTEKGNASVFNSTMKALWSDTYGDKSAVKHEHTHGGNVVLYHIKDTESPDLYKNDAIEEALVIENE